MQTHKPHPHRYLHRHPEKRSAARLPRSFLRLGALAVTAAGLLALGRAVQGHRDWPGSPVRPGEEHLPERFAPEQLDIARRGGSHVRFVVIGDTRRSRHPGVNLPVLRKIVGRIARLDPAPRFVLHTGDITTFGGRARSPKANPQSGEFEYDEFRMAMLPIQSRGIPLLIAQGNHDVHAQLGVEFRHEVFMRHVKNTATLQEAYGKGLFSRRAECPGEENLTFSFTAGPARFVVVTCYLGEQARMSETEFIGYRTEGLSEAQRWLQKRGLLDPRALDRPVPKVDWRPAVPSRAAVRFLREELEAGRQAGEHVFVVAHPPAFPVAAHFGSSLDVYPELRDHIWRLLCTFGASGYICGHEHNYHRVRIARRGETDFSPGCYQFGNGTAGALRRRAPKYAVDAFYNRHCFTVYDVAGPDVRLQSFDPDGKLFDTFHYQMPGRGHPPGVAGSPSPQRRLAAQMR